MIGTFTLVLFYLVAPAGVLWLCRRYRFFDLIGPVLILYIIGIVIGNMPFLPDSASKVQQILSSAIVPVAIPLMLFGCNFRRFNFRRSLLILVCGIAAVAVAVVAGFFIFRNRLVDDPAKIGGMLVGVYTGGTPNLAALKMMLGVSEESFILINSYDMVVSFIYLAFLVSAGIPLFRRLLPAKATNDGDRSVDLNQNEFVRYPYHHFFTRANVVQVLKAVGWSVTILAVSGGAALLVNKLAGSDRWFMTVLILMLTTLGIVASYQPAVRKLDKSFDAGMYLIYIFSIVVASMADLGSLDLSGGLFLLLYLAFVIFGSLALNLLLARLLHLDADSVIIGSVALINSPPFVPMIATAMNNRNVIVTGLGVGIVGYAAGNYLGFLICNLLACL